MKLEQVLKQKYPRYAERLLEMNYGILVKKVIKAEAI
jgi:hypothetical protein